MSGPKAWHFTVQGQALLRTFAVAFESIDDLEVEWADLEAQVGDAQAEFGTDEIRVSMARPRAFPGARKVTIEEANRHLLALQSAVSRLAAALAGEIQRNERARLSAQAQAEAVRGRAGDIVSDLMADMVRATPELTTPANKLESQSIPSPLAIVAEAGVPESGSEAMPEATAAGGPASGFERILGRLAPEVPDSVRAEIVTLAEQRGGDAFAIEGRMADVRRRVQEANLGAKRWQAEEEALHLLLLQSRAFDGDSAAEWVGVLEGALADRRALAPDRRAEAEAFVLETAAAEERRAVQRAVEETLVDLGYEVGDAFQTLFVDGGSVYAQRPAWGEYFVRWRVDDESGEANTNVVRAPTAADDSSVDRARRDREIEEAWCGDAARLGEALKLRGVQALLTRSTPAGALPVPVLKQSPAGAAEARANRVHRPLARKLGE